MNLFVQIEPKDNEDVDYVSIMTVICHLMTLYAIHPCEALASNINRHLSLVVNSSTNESLGEWKGAYRHILSQWELITEHHLQPSKPTEQVFYFSLIKEKTWRSHLAPLNH